MTEEIEYGPTADFSKILHAEKYRSPHESFIDAVNRISGTLADDEEHRKRLKESLKLMRWLPAGRVQAAVGSPHLTTAFNCFVSGTIDDSMVGIMDCFKDAALTMRQGGGIGYDFSPIRPMHSNIASLSSPSSGPVSFMHIGDSVCSTVSSAGNRRGAQMAVLRVDHPDIETFITAKRANGVLTRYNMSVGITDEFMKCLINGEQFPLQFNGIIHSYIDPTYLWDLIMRSTWDWAEPGVLFLDRINGENPLYYCETICATNPCGEQPLPPNGACLLGSFNLTKYVTMTYTKKESALTYGFDFELFKADIRDAVRATDNVIDSTIYPLPEQEAEAKSKRRMGLGITGLANTLEVLGMPYASTDFIKQTVKIMRTLRNTAYETSIELAREKGSFPLLDSAKYLKSGFAKNLPKHIREGIRDVGLRNSHLISIAPTGTISFCADNISSGIEPPFSLEVNRTVQGSNGEVVVKVIDFAYREWGVKGVCADELTPQQHMSVQVACQPFVDSAISKTCNVGDNTTWEEFKGLYLDAWKAGLKGITTFRSAGKKFGILNKVEIDQDEEPNGEACFINPQTGEKDCG